MKEKRVLIGSPIHQQPTILREFLMSLSELEQDDVIIEFLFMDDNEDEESSSLLTAFADKHNKTCIYKSHEKPKHYHCDDYTHYWGEDQIWKVGGLKDHIISYAIENNYDYLFLVDSDLVLHPCTLKQLIRANKDIISNVFWTRWQPNSDALPQVWMHGEYTLYSKLRNEKLTDEEIQLRTTEFLHKLRQPGVYEVGGLGACTLISKYALSSGVKFAEISNLSYWGEDRHFCVRAAALGFSLFVDTHYPTYHIYRPSDLTVVPKYKQGWCNEKDAQTTISLCMIVKNEEDVLERCLTSVKEFVDEIIIVDTGSTDQTKDIASKFTDKIFDFKWVNDFSVARNYAFSKATQKYILWLDADDFFKEEDRNLLLNLRNTLDPSIDSVTMDYHLAFDEEGKVTYSLRRNRLVRRDCHFKWIGFVHEYLEVSGNIFHSEVAVTHKKEKSYTDRNLQIYRKHQQAGANFSVRDLYYFANELRDHFFYEEAIEYYEKFLLTQQGWVEDNISACLKLADCYRHLCEREQEFQAAMRTMNYDQPRAEACCHLGNIFMEEKQWTQAMFWYQLATQLEKPTNMMASVDYASWTWVPHLQLCICYDHLGNIEKANYHNDLACSFNPTNPSIQHNKKYFKKVLSDRKRKSEEVCK